MPSSPNAAWQLSDSSHSQLLQSCWIFNPPAAGGCRTPAPNCPDKQLQLRINQHGKSHLQQACGKHQLAIVLGQQLLLRGLLQPADDLHRFDWGKRVQALVVGIGAPSTGFKGCTGQGRIARTQPPSHVQHALAAGGAINAPALVIETQPTKLVQQPFSHGAGSGGR